jgi:hypothetical protein
MGYRFFCPILKSGDGWHIPGFVATGTGGFFPHLVRIFHACLSIGYVLAIWRWVEIVFIPKPGRNSYSVSRDYRLISLPSFLLKTMERLEDRYLRDKTLALM